MAQSVLVWRAKEKNVYVKEDVKRNSNKRMTIGEDYKKVGDEAFKNNIKVREVDLGNGISEIGRESFQGCTALRKVDLRRVRVIRKGAFSGCTNLTEIIFPQELEAVGARAFAMCKRLVRAEGGGMAYEDRAFYKCKSLKHIDMPEGLRKIGREAFYNTGLEEVNFPNTLEIIGDSSFLKCRELTHIKIPKSVRVIEKWAFHGCNRLQTVELLHDPEIIGEWITNKSTKIRCKKGSKVEEYCKVYGLETEFVQ